MEPSKFASMLHRRSNKITRVLIYVLLEWILIFLLLINSLFSYFILKFALYFGLKPPCVFCSRLHHHDSQQQKHTISSSYKDIICEQHAAEISTIGFCSHHRKLVESRILCEDCSESSPSRQRKEEDAPLFKWMREIGLVKEDENDDVVVKKCCCCNVMMKPKKVLCSSPLNFMADLITNRELDECFPDQETGDFVINNNQRDFGNSDQSDFGYQVLDDGDGDEDEDEEERENDVVSEAEKVPLLTTIKNNDDDEIHNINDEIVSAQHLEFYIDHDDYRLIPVQVVGEEERDFERNSVGEVTGKEDESLELCREVDLIFEGNELLGCCEVSGKNLASIQEEDEHFDSGCGRGETTFEQLVAAEEEEQVAADENLHMVAAEEEEVEETTIGCGRGGKKDSTFGLEVEEVTADENLHMVAAEEEKMEGNLLLSKETENLTVLQKQDENLHMVAAEEEKQVEETSQMVAAEEEEEEVENLTVVQEQERFPVVECTDRNSSTSVYKEELESHLIRDETDTEKNENLIQDSIIEVDMDHMPCKNESSTCDENDGKQAEGEAEKYMERLNVNVGLCNNEVEVERIPDTPTSTDSLHLHKKLLVLGRRGSVTEESLDGSIISELEGGDGAATVEKLKSELQAERKTLRALYAELEEERNASAIAANQTLAMINRLQEEKASMQMEALQYQRMMEEQSEYDQEALQMMNELMVKREKEKQELEKELEVYRKKLMDFEEREKMRILSRRMEGSMRSRNSSASCSYGEESDGLSVDLNHEAKDQDQEDISGISPHCREENGHQDTPTDAVLNLQDSLASFEDERQSILEQLKVLEEKLFTLSEEEDEHIENMRPFEQFYEENGKDFDDSYKVESEANGEETGRWLNGSMPKRLLPLFDAAEFLDSPDGTLDGKEDEFDMVLHKSPVTKFELEKKKMAIEEEVDHVYERLHALEADREFLKHCIGSLRKGDKGLDLLQEILQHLRDLKNVELQVMKNMDPCASV